MFRWTMSLTVILVALPLSGCGAQSSGGVDITVDRVTAPEDC